MVCNIEGVDLVMENKTTKICAHCKVEQPKENFYKNTKAKDGLGSWCKSCSREFNIAYRASHPSLPRPIIPCNVPDTKVCNRCKIEKDINEFYLNCGTKDGRATICKRCIAIQRQKEGPRVLTEEQRKRALEQSKRYYEEHKEQVLARSQRYYEEHKEQKRQQGKAYKQRNRAKIAAYYQENKDRLSTERKERYWSDPIFRLNRLISSYMSRSLKGEKCERHWESLIPYTLQDLVKHLEKQFLPGMTWDNYGSEWEVDHIIPLGTLKYSSTEEDNFIIAWGLANLRPLWSSENKSRPKNGSDISEEMKQRIVRINLEYAELKREEVI